MISRITKANQPLNARPSAPAYWSTLKTDDNTTSKSQTHIAHKSLMHQIAANTAGPTLFTFIQKSNEMLAPKSSEAVSLHTANQKSLNSFKSSQAGFRHLFYQGTDHSEMKFQEVYRGISKKDIINKPTKEIYNRIQANIDQSQRQAQYARANQLKS